MQMISLMDRCVCVGGGGGGGGSVRDQCQGLAGKPTPGVLCVRITHCTALPLPPPPPPTPHPGRLLKRGAPGPMHHSVPGAGHILLRRTHRVCALAGGARRCVYVCELGGCCAPLLVHARQAAHAGSVCASASLTPAPRPALPSPALSAPGARAGGEYRSNPPLPGHAPPRPRGYDGGALLAAGCVARPCRPGRVPCPGARTACPLGPIPRRPALALPPPPRRPLWPVRRGAVQVCEELCWVLCDDVPAGCGRPPPGQPHAGHRRAPLPHRLWLHPWWGRTRAAGLRLGWAGLGWAGLGWVVRRVCFLSNREQERSASSSLHPAPAARPP